MTFPAEDDIFGGNKIFVADFGPLTQPDQLSSKGLGRNSSLRLHAQIKAGEFW
jgi:hypothetical protein